jgi:hypothetical protein
MKDNIMGVGRVSASGLPSGLTINASTGLITGTISGSTTTYTPTVTASDGQGASVTSQTFTWNVSTLSVTNPGTQAYLPGSTVSLPIQASGLPTGDTFAFSATGLPGGLSINASTGVISGALTAAVNSYSVTVKASDGHGASASQTFTIYVQNAVVVKTNAVNITYGTALDNSQLTGTAKNAHGQAVAGAFSFTSAAGAILHAGNGQIELVTFTPSDPTYTTVQTTVAVNVAQATPNVTPNPVTITYGTVLDNSQLSGTATFIVKSLSVNVAGAFAYTQAPAPCLLRGRTPAWSPSRRPT